MVTTSISNNLLAELYVVDTDNFPQLFAWTPEINASETQSVGWKLAYRLRNDFGGTWIWVENRLVTDQSVSDEVMQTTLKSLWESNVIDFGQILFIHSDTNWQPQVLTVAEFVASGLVALHHWKIKNLLKKYNRNISRARIEREYYVRGWDMNGIPAISISVASTIASTIDFAMHARQLSAKDYSRVLGLLVRDKTSTMKGEIVRVVGKLRDHRSRLLQLTKRKKMIDTINNAPDDDLVVNVASGNNEYDYITSALEIVVRNKDYQRLQIDGQQALRSLQIEPELRFAIVQQIAELLANENYVFSEPVGYTNSPNNFKSSKDIGFNPSVTLGDGHICRADARTVLSSLKYHPVYRRSPEFLDSASIRIGILNFIGDDARVPSYLGGIRKELHQIQFDVEFTSAERPDEQSQYEIEQAIDRLQEQEPHIIMVFVPGSPSENDEDEDGGTYRSIKSYMVGNGIISQFIYEHTLDKQYALANIVLGIVAKTGNIPYVLEKSLTYADIVVGVDVARIATQRRSGSMSLPAVARIYTSEGDFIRYILTESPIEGETLPKLALRKLFPANLFAGKRVLVHRDGPFRGNEMDELYKWGDEISADFMLVEVIKSGVPRIYRDNNSIARPRKGDALILNNHEAFLVSSLPPTKQSTPRPLYVRTDGKITIENALHSILSLTLMHYGSVLQPRLPVTIHFSDRIGYLALQGIKPPSTEGSQPFWI